MFVGRKKELQWLTEAYQSGKGELVVIYGRRRIGKSCLVKKFAEDKQKIGILQPSLDLGRYLGVISFFLRFFSYHHPVTAFFRSNPF